MSFDFDIHIAEGSPEGQSIQAVIEREHVAPEEALRLILREASAISEQPAVIKRRRGPRPPNLDVAARTSVIGMLADRRDITAEIDAVVASRAERYAEPR